MHGVVFPVAGDEAPPGFLLCDGELHDAADYPALFAVTGTKFNLVGDPDGKFRVPDLRGRVIAGADNMGGSVAGRLTTSGSGVNGGVLGAAGGAESHTLAEAEMPEHGHAGSAASGGAHTHSGSASSAGAHPHTVNALNNGMRTTTTEKVVTADDSVADDKQQSS